MCPVLPILDDSHPSNLLENLNVRAILFQYQSINVDLFVFQVRQAAEVLLYRLPSSHLLVSIYLILGKSTSFSDKICVL